MMHPDEIRIEPDTARGLIDAQFPGFRNKPLQLVSFQGTVNTIFRVGDDLVGRFPLQPEDGSARNIRNTAFALREFAGVNPFLSSNHVGTGRPGPGYPLYWSLQNWIGGEIAGSDSHEQSVPLSLDLAELISSLRKANTRERKFSGSGRGGVLQEHDGWMETCFSRSGHLFNVPRLRKIWAFFRKCPAPDKLVMSHKDLTPPNLVVEGDRLRGILDAGAFGPADPGLDLVCAWHLFDSERRSVFRSALAIEDAEWIRGAGWAFQQAMGLAWYYEHSHPKMSRLGRVSIGRIVSDELILDAAGLGKISADEDFG